MSKFTEEWQKTKKDLGHMVSLMESMASKYGDCTELEEKYYQKGYNEGYKKGLAHVKSEICKDCADKVTADKCYLYAGLVREYDNLDYDEREIIDNLIEHFLESKK